MNSRCWLIPHIGVALTLLAAHGQAQSIQMPSSLKKFSEGLKIKPSTESKSLPDSGKIEGVFSSVKGEPTFITKDGKALRVEGAMIDAETLTKTTASSTPATLTYKKLPDKSFSIDEIDPTHAAAFRETVGRIQNSKLKEKLTESYRSFIDASAGAIARDAPAKAAENFRMVKQQILSAVRETPSLEWKDRLEAGRLYRQARLQHKASSNKAVFLFDDRFTPDTYPLVYKTCDSVGALKFAGSVVGTVFLVGKNVVLTCRHCLRDKNQMPLLTASFSVFFGKKPESSPGDGRRYPVARKVFEGTNDSEDYVVLEVGAGNKTPAEDGLSIITLDAEDAAQKDNAVYAIGFPGGHDMMVADASHVLIPYLVSNEGFEDLTNDFNGQYAEAYDAESKQYADRPGTAERLAQERMRRFKASFIPQSVGGQAAWRFESIFLDDTAPLPAIGIDTDTFRGNSGSPVLERKHSTVVGMLARGVQDGLASLQAGFDFHEEAIPISHILAKWKEATKDKPADQPAAFGINVP